jgi:hypothetical protein
MNLLLILQHFTSDKRVVSWISAIGTHSTNQFLFYLLYILLIYIRGRRFRATAGSGTLNASFIVLHLLPVYIDFLLLAYFIILIYITSSGFRATADAATLNNSFRVLHLLPIYIHSLLLSCLLHHQRAQIL